MGPWRWLAVRRAAGPPGESTPTTAVVRPGRRIIPHRIRQRDRVRTSATVIRVARSPIGAIPVHGSPGAGIATETQKLGTVRNNIDSTLIQRSSENNIVQALAGKAPNVEVVGQSGEPGASSFIRIRGQKTIRGTGQPLIVVDGMPVDNTTNTTLGFLGGTASPNRASDLNPNDVANIEILKGAADAAVYGARAGQGVVLITTKAGATTNRPGQPRA